MTLSEVFALLNAAIKQAGSQTAFARAHGIPLQRVNDAVNGGIPGRDVLRALGLRAKTTYERVSSPEIPECLGGE